MLGTWKLGKREFRLWLEDLVESFDFLREAVWAAVSGLWDTTQESFAELVESLGDFPDFRLIQASITLSAHSRLFLGSSRTSSSNFFQSSAV